MIQDNELSAMLVISGVAIYLLLNLGRADRIPGSKVLLSAFFFLFSAHVLTLVEEFFLERVMNLLEHTCYAASAILTALWCRRTFFTDRINP